MKDWQSGRSGEVFFCCCCCVCLFLLCFAFLKLIILATDWKKESDWGWKARRTKMITDIAYSLYCFKIIKLTQFWQDAYATSLGISLPLSAEADWLTGTTTELEIKHFQVLIQVLDPWVSLAKSFSLSASHVSSPNSDAIYFTLHWWKGLPVFMNVLSFKHGTWSMKARSCQLFRTV